MSDRKREKRRAKALAKKKQRRAVQKRAGKNPRDGILSEIDATDAQDWPVGDAFASESWHEAGALVHVVFSRSHPDGRTMLAHFELDLAAPAVASTQVRTASTPDVVGWHCARISEGGGEAMVSVSPEQAARLVRDTALAARDAEFDPPPGWQVAAALFRDVDADAAAFGPALGEEREARRERTGGLFGWLGRLFGG